MENEQIRLKLKKIQEELSIKTVKMAALLDMNPQTYRNSLSAKNPTNNFKNVDFKVLKTKIKESVDQAFS